MAACGRWRAQVPPLGTAGTGTATTDVSVDRPGSVIDSKECGRRYGGEEAGEGDEGR